MFDSPMILILGHFTGFLFGFLLQKGSVTKFDVIVNQFRLKDFTVLKIMLTANVVGGIGVYALYGMGMAKLSIKPAVLVANVAGGLIFGMGMVILGLCPGTALAAAGEGNRRALVGILGMLTGALLLTETYPFFADAAKAVNLGNLTFPQAVGMSAWVILVILAAIAASLFLVLEKWKRSRGSPSAIGSVHEIDLRIAEESRKERVLMR